MLACHQHVAHELHKYFFLTAQRDKLGDLISLVQFHRSGQTSHRVAVLISYGGDSSGREWATERTGFLDTAFIEPTPEAAALQDEINQMLDRYRTKHVISGAVENEKGLQVLPQFVERKPKSTEWKVTEAHAASMVVSMAQTGMLDRVKKCGWCERWFVASRSDRVFCSESCKRKHQSSSPEFKEQRAAYMRQRYKQQKEKNG